MDRAQPILFHPPRRAGRLARLGDWMVQHRRAILALQWAIVVFYALLVVVPAFLPAPSAEARLFSSDLGASSFVESGSGGPAQAKTPQAALWHERLVLLAQYLFWGVWWPFVILSVMLLGRVWCGVLCPEGALSEFASRHGRGGPIPRWMRWSGWPVLAFLLTTVYGQLVSVYEYPRAALLVLGGSTLAAIAVGALYGRGKRVWCRYLCPVSGVFALLARLAPLHFRVDRERWASFPARTAAVDCAPLLDVKRLAGAAQCHACGRCSGHRGAVALAARSPHAEILDAGRPATPEVVLLIFGLLGTALAAFQWSVSPWFVRAKQAAATWLVEHDILWPLDAGAPWWLLTRAPDGGEAFTWLDGGAILVYIGVVALALGGCLCLILALTARLARRHWQALALGLVPLAGLGLFLGLSMMSANHLRAEGVPLGWLGPLRAALLALGVAWSASLGLRLVAAGPAGVARRALAGLSYLGAVAAVAANWVLVLFVW